MGGGASIGHGLSSAVSEQYLSDQGEELGKSQTRVKIDRVNKTNIIETNTSLGMGEINASALMLVDDSINLSTANYKNFKQPPASKNKSSLNIPYKLPQTSKNCDLVQHISFKTQKGNSKNRKHSIVMTISERSEDPMVNPMAIRSETKTNLRGKMMMALRKQF